MLLFRKKSNMIIQTLKAKKDYQEIGKIRNCQRLIGQIGRSGDR